MCVCVCVCDQTYIIEIEVLNAAEPSERGRNTPTKIVVVEIQLYHRAVSALDAVPVIGARGPDHPVCTLNPQVPAGLQV